MDLKSKDDSKWYLQNNLAEHKYSTVKLDRLEIKSVDFWGDGKPKYPGKRLLEESREKTNPKLEIELETVICRRRVVAWREEIQE